MRVIASTLFLGLSVASALGIYPSTAFGDIARFSQVSPGIYRGGIPDTEADFAELKRLGVKTIVNLETMSIHVDWSRGNAGKLGMRFVHAPLTPMFLKPQPRQVDAALAALGNPNLQPVFVHCYQGKDRTGMIVALHRVLSEGWSPSRAYEEWQSFGFDPNIFTRAFDEYFWEQVK